jgi:tRNA uridine 5-carboxymethylaminomethyl modification enzyme
VFHVKQSEHATKTMSLSYDIVVVGGGHAGSEAALAAARMGMRTLLISMDLSKIGQMSCNPAIGGLAKGQLVREIDALGGEMALATDDAGIQFRMLNRSKGPAVWSPRAQCDRQAYAQRIQAACKMESRLDLLAGTAVGIEVRLGLVTAVHLDDGTRVESGAVVLTAGTFLNGVIHIGLVTYRAGRAGEFSVRGLTECLIDLGFERGRLKTGTPPRLDGRTIDFSKCALQPGDADPAPFSFRHDRLSVEQLPCYLTYTHEETHAILRTGIDRSPMFTGRIKGVGPRYCPSIEDKIFRFADKPSHQIFLEPEGRNTTEYYVNGFSTSLPEEVQLKAIRTIPGLERVRVTRLGYAVEYDFFPPTQLHPSLETKRIGNLFFAGQINGTTGYEEAASQGLIAGINAVLKLRGEEPLVLDRSQAYIGVLIDDLVTKGTIEPYRMFTSRAEHRLLLRQDNADLRLSALGYRLGLIPEDVFRRVERKRRAIRESLQALRTLRVSPEIVNQRLIACGSTPISEPVTLYQLLKRPELSIRDLHGLGNLECLHRERDAFWRQVAEQVEIEAKYEGFIQRQENEAERFRKLESKRIPDDFDYQAIRALSKEAREKLQKIRPRSIGQAARISGVSPADVSVLLVFLRQRQESVSRETQQAA